MKKVKVNTKCVAGTYAAGNETIIEFSLPGTTTGGLISFRVLEDGTVVIDPYRLDGPVKVLSPRWVTIFEALDVIGQVEGEEWRKQQWENQKSPHGYFAYLNAWYVIQNDPELRGTKPCEAIQMGLVPGVKGTGDGAIYGKGGYSRYHVSRDGVVTLDYSTATEEKAQKARELGL